ncbi:MAG TPA: hypothetical protein DDW78_10475 [Treponema sp.]|nr:hypothetical protein [Treponema sp.]
MGDWYIDWVALGLCAAGLLAYIAVLVVFVPRIRREKQRLAAAGTELPRAGRRFWWVFAVALVLIVLPLLVPLQHSVIAVVCAVGVLGEYIVLRERLALLRGI